MLESAYPSARDLGEVRMGRPRTKFRVEFENTWKDQAQV